MNKLFPILLTITLSLSSCANWLDNEEMPDLPDSVTLSRHQLTMLVGDTCRFDAVFSPEDYPEQGLLWVSTVAGILDVNGNTVVARSAGSTNVVITSAMGLKSDTCRVEVQPAWGEPPLELYDMVVYAAVDPSIDPETSELAAFCGNELCGRGVRRTDHGVTYTVFRIYSAMMDTEDYKVPITFRCHLRNEGRVVQFPDTIYFDGEAHGSLSNLYQLYLE